MRDRRDQAQRRGPGDARRGRRCRLGARRYAALGDATTRFTPALVDKAGRLEQQLRDAHTDRDGSAAGLRLEVDDGVLPGEDLERSLGAAELGLAGVDQRALGEVEHALRPVGPVGPVRAGPQGAGHALHAEQLDEAGDRDALDARAAPGVVEQQLHAAHERLGVERLFEVFERAIRQGARLATGGPVGGHHDDGHGDATAGELSQQLQPAHVGHGQVGDEEVDVLTLEGQQGLNAVAGAGDPHAGDARPEHPFADLPAHHVVIDEQDVPSIRVRVHGRDPAEICIVGPSAAGERPPGRRSFTC